MRKFSVFWGFLFLLYSDQLVFAKEYCVVSQGEGVFTSNKCAKCRAGGGDLGKAECRIRTKSFIGLKCKDGACIPDVTKIFNPGGVVVHNGRCNSERNKNRCCGNASKGKCKKLIVELERMYDSCFGINVPGSRFESERSICDGERSVGTRVSYRCVDGRVHERRQATCDGQVLGKGDVCLCSGKIRRRTPGGIDIEFEMD